MVSRNRFNRVVDVLNGRQPELTVVLDGVHKPHNLSAIVRTCDAVGVLDVHAIPPDDVRLPVLNGTAQGSGRWVRVHRHKRFADAHDSLKAKGYQTLAAHLSEQAIDFREIDYTKPTAVILGAEKCGVDSDTADRVDQHIIIPMHGMVESLNVSVANALILYEAQTQRERAGMYGQSRLPRDEYETLLFEWLHPKMARYCRDTGQPYPPIDDDGQIVGRLKGMVDNAG